MVTHVFVDHIGNNITCMERFQQVVELKGVMDHSDLQEHEDDFAPFMMTSGNTTNSLSLETIVTHILALSRSISPLLPPPKVA